MNAYEKMRDAMEQIDRIVWDKHRHTKEETEAHRLATEALTVPPRNCDVGTAEEQADRFFDFCDGYHYATGYNGCGTCPLWTSGTIGEHCELKWAQMPYEGGM